MMGFSLEIVQLFALDLFYCRGERPSGVLLTVELLAGLPAQHLPGHNLLHTHPSSSRFHFLYKTAGDNTVQAL